MHGTRLIVSALVVLATFSFSGCLTTERSASRVVVPVEWQKGYSRGGSLDVEALSEWWERFHDPVLDRLITLSLEGNTDIQTAVSRIEESRAQRGVTRAALLPSVNGDATSRFNWSNSSGNNNLNNGLPGNSSTFSGQSGDTFLVGVDASWEVDLFGKLRQDLYASSADLEQTIENLHSTRVSLAAEVADAYVTLRAAEARLAVFRRNVAASDETATMTRWQEQAGEGTAFSTQQAKSQLKQARSTIPTIQQTIEQTRNRLALLAGRSPGILNSILTGRSAEVPTPPSLPSLGIPADVLRQRPDIRAAEWALLAAVARTKSAEREQLPSLTLSGTFSVEALTNGSLFSPETAAANAVGQLTAPIFAGGRIRENIRVQSARETQALIAWEAAVLNALSEVENALIAIRRTSEQLEILRVAVAAAREAEELARLNYEAGEIDLLDVLTAQRTLLSLEESLAINRGNKASAHIQLYKSLGGGWTN